MTVPVIGEVQVVLDATTGFMLERTMIPEGKTNIYGSPEAIKQLGTPTEVTLSSASFG